MHFILFGATAPGRKKGCSETSSTTIPCARHRHEHRNKLALAHTPTREPWLIITPTASGELNAHVGPITALDKGHGTPKTLLLCLSPKPCVCFAWLHELDLWIFTAFWPRYIPVVLKNVKSSHGTNLKMQYPKAAPLEDIVIFSICKFSLFLRFCVFSSKNIIPYFL